MASNPVRAPARNRIGAQRVKGDENATSKHKRQSSTTSGQIDKGSVYSRSSFTHAVVNGIKTGLSRPVLNEVTTVAVNRKDTGFRPAAKEKEIAHKRNSSGTLVPSHAAQRVPVPPARPSIQPPPRAATNSTFARARGIVPRLQTHIARRSQHISSPEPEPVKLLSREDDVPPSSDSDGVPPPNSDIDGMQMEESLAEDSCTEDESTSATREDEATIQMPKAIVETVAVETTSAPKPPRVWPDFDTERKIKYQKDIDAVREVFRDDIDELDANMVSEYSEEVFEYMSQLEESMMPCPEYMDGQAEITWGMRQTLVDWLLQVHMRYHMLPETLWITINIVDRFLSRRVVSLGKLQLVGVSAMFIACKYEEILAPSVDEFVLMTEKGYTREEVLKGEQIVLQTLDYRISHYCSPYSWMRRISKADEYDMQTRTLSKFLTEVTLLDWQFLKVKPSLVAAVGMYSARKMLGGDWNAAFMFYSAYTEEQLLQGHHLILQKLIEPNFHRQYVCKKYASKRFLKASVFAIEWAKMHMEAGELDAKTFEELMAEE